MLDELSEIECAWIRYREITDDYLKLLKQRLEKSEQHATRQKETIDYLLRINEKPPVGFCNACTKLWVDRSRPAVDEIKEMMGGD